jgi:ribosomal protein S18 acetylase RimI-like enzyme
MVCLLKVNPSDPSLASINTNRFELTSLWIYPAYRALRLNNNTSGSTIGTTIISEMERQAALRGAEYVTFNTTAGANQTLKTFERIGYREYKPREHRYSITDVVNVGLPGSMESTLAAFFEKRVKGVERSAVS